MKQFFVIFEQIFEAFVVKKFLFFNLIPV